MAASLFGCSPSSDLAELIDETPWIDTHEHLVRESGRLHNTEYRFRDPLSGQYLIPGDWVALISSYVLSDMVSAGLPSDARDALLCGDRSPLEKWELAAPYIEAVRHGGYMSAVDITTERLFGARLAYENCEPISQQLSELRVPGFYRRLLQEHANIEKCQVHSLDADPIGEAEDSALLQFDLSIGQIVTGRHADLEQRAEIEVRTLQDYLDVMEWCFDRHGASAVALKCHWAYRRQLGVALPPGSPLAAFERLRRDAADGDEQRSVEDFLFSRCMELAARYDLPVKLHLGTLDYAWNPNLRWVRDHVRDAGLLAQRFPAVRFVLMHTAWPHTEELMALAKHQPNVVVDLCWSWVLAPYATVGFLRNAITCVPGNKLLGFGGDYSVAECVVGHAEIARRGLQRALEMLISDGWISSGDARDLARAVMRGNAETIFSR